MLIRELEEEEEEERPRCQKPTPERESARKRKRIDLVKLTMDRGLLLSRPAGVRKGIIGYCLVITFRGQILRSEMGERKCSIEVIVW